MWTVEDGIEALKKNKAKITAQRVAMLSRLQGRKDHPSAETLYKELLSDIDGLSVATVYSTAQLFSDIGLIKILSIDTKRVYFDPNIAAHGHFMCKKCGKLVDLHINKEKFYEDAVMEQGIGTVDHADVFLYGTCSSCCRG